MGRAQVIETVCAELRARHSAHTILLYGSEADGTATPESDIDIAAFAPVETVVRDARMLHGTYIDVFVYPEAALQAAQIDHLRFRGARVLIQRGTAATTFLSALDQLHDAGPAPLPADELAVRREWAWKMLGRLRKGDVEGNYRRSWLLTALLEDYFHLRGYWFEGPKKSLAWLRENDPQTSHAFAAALVPDADASSIEDLVECVVGQPSGESTNHMIV